MIKSIILGHLYFMCEHTNIISNYDEKYQIMKNKPAHSMMLKYKKKEIINFD